jgi:predicted MPP superfamily phosphohydrolase
MIRFLLNLLGLLAVYCWWVEPARLSVTAHDVSDPDRPLVNPIRVLLLTDWHLGRFTRPRVLRSKINRLLRRHRRDPFDLMLLGGDFIDDDARHLPLLAAALRQTQQFHIPILAVLGNHDHFSFGGDAAPLVECLQMWGVSVLRNQAAAVQVGGQRLLIVGLEDLQESPNYYRADVYQTPEHYRQAAAGLDWYARLDGLEPHTPRLLLAHNPDAVWMPGLRPMATLAGHTHGGQVMLLDWFSRRLHRRLARHLPPGSAVTWAGRQEINGRTLIVSRGMEGAALPLRLGRAPEAVVITLS